MKKIGLVLGSGGLRGMAHIGVLKVLEEENIPIAFIVGCSIGSLVGGLYASGYSAKRLERMAKCVKRSEWIELVFPRMGLFSGKKILTAIDKMTRQQMMEETRVPLYIVATDLYRGERVVLQNGNLAEAICASCAVPGIFEPYAKDGTLYVDGALVDPIPVDVARTIGADIVVGVDLMHGSNVPAIESIFDVVLQSFEVVQRQLGREKYEDADMMIYPAVSHFSQSAFDKVRECILIGEYAMRAQIDELRKLIGS